jgi:hypothetical protein
MTILKGVQLLIAMAGMPVSTFCQMPALKVAPVPNDPLEMVSGQVQVVSTPEEREAILGLLSRARINYSLRGSSKGYDLKVSFSVNSGGATEYDGAWEMEEIYGPRMGFRWTAKSAAGFTTTQISANRLYYAEGTASALPLRLHEARSALFGPIATPLYMDKDLIRTSQGSLNGVALTCVLLSGAQNPATPTPGRRWEEMEECIDPQTGLLRVHSLAPGRYELYDYTNAPKLVNHTMPRTVTITEGGKTVMELHVDSLTELPAVDPSLFVPSAEMKAGEPGIMLAEARKVSVFNSRVGRGADAVVQPVCVFGLVTPSGKVTEAHSLQPSDPNSQAAVEAAKRMNFYTPTPPGARPEQRFVFIIEKFISTQ